MLEKIKATLVCMNQKGIPVPTLRDPVTGLPSVTFTLVFISANVVLIGMLGKLANFFGGVDLTQALYWNGLTLGTYLGKKVIDKSTETKEDNK